MALHLIKLSSKDTFLVRFPNSPKCHTLGLLAREREECFSHGKEIGECCVQYGTIVKSSKHSMPLSLVYCVELSNGNLQPVLEIL